MIGDKNYDDMNARYVKATREADHREYLEYKREIMEMDEQSAAKMVECPKCRGTGWIWSTEIPGLRKRCDDCDGTGQMEDD